jgi:hypothetical protein
MSTSPLQRLTLPLLFVFLGLPIAPVLAQSKFLSEAEACFRAYRETIPDHRWSFERPHFEESIEYGGLRYHPVFFTADGQFQGDIVLVTDGKGGCQVPIVNSHGELSLEDYKAVLGSGVVQEMIQRSQGQ